jgi:BlaI family transcriptional regulator, penicillinase repressor
MKNNYLLCRLNSGTLRTVTTRTGSSARVRTPLTELENDVMQVVWDTGLCSVEAVYIVVSRKHDLKETSVRTILRRLEQKGYLRHEEKGRAYVYRAAEPPRNLAARAVRQIIDRFCKGSVEELVSGMVEAKVLSKSEIECLENFVRGTKGGN